MITVPANYTTANAQKNRTPVYRLTFIEGTEVATHPIKDNYSEVVLADTPAAYWRLGESSGTSAVDSSGNSITGTYVNTPTLGATGALTKDSNTAVGFSAASSERVDANSALLRTAAAVTVEAWIYPTLNDADDKTIVRTGLATDLQYMFFVSNLTLGYFYHDGSNFVSHRTGTVLTLNTWQHVALVRISDGKGLTFYVNGASVATATAANTGRATVAQASGVGGNSGSGAQYFTGTLDEVAVYTSALSATRIRAHYDAGLMLYNRPNVDVLMQLPKGIQSQVIPDRGQASVGTMTAVVVDELGVITDLLKTSNAIGGSVVIFSAGFDDIREADYMDWSFVVGDYRLTRDLSAYEFTLRQAASLTNKEVFEVSTTYLTDPCNDTDLTFNVTSTTFFVDATTYRYIIIDEEIIAWGDKTGTTFTSSGTYPVVRGAFGTTAAAHDAGAQVREMIRLYGHPMDVLQDILTNTDKTGLSIDASLVDSTAFDAVKTAMGAFVKVDFRITARENAQQFLEDQFYRPFACYPVATADGTISIKQFSTPVSGVDTITHDNIITDSQGRPVLGWEGNFQTLINAVGYTYDYDIFLAEYITASDPTEDSASIAAYGRAPLGIPSRGIRSFFTYADTFDRANSNSLGSDWTESEQAAGDIKILTNQLVLGDTTSANSHGIAMWAGATVGRDQYSELTFVSVAGVLAAQSGPAVRMSGTDGAFTGFAVVYIHDSVTPVLSFYSFNGVNLGAGGGTAGNTYIVTLVPGDIVGIRADDETLYMYLNGVQVATMATDFSNASGQPGALLKNVAFTGTTWDSWAGGDNTGDTQTLLDTLGQLILDRYADGGASQVKATTFLSKHLLEAGDIISLTSDLLPDLATGLRGITAGLYEVTQSQVNFDQGNVALTLLEV